MNEHDDDIEPEVNDHAAIESEEFAILDVDEEELEEDEDVRDLDIDSDESEL